MSSFEHLDDLRKQNKELLQKLKHKPENLQGLHLEYLRKQTENKTPMPKVLKSADRSARDRTPLKKENETLLNISDDFINLTVSEKLIKKPRSALCEPINSRNTPKTGTEMASGCLAGEEEKRLSEDTVCDVILQDRTNSRLRVRLNPTEMIKPESDISQEKSQRVLGRVRFPPGDDESESVSISERRRVPPLLGYDWIAGLLDAESSLTERSEQFFSELHTFRQVNKEECVHNIYSWLPDAADRLSSSVEDGVTNREHAIDSHQCTFRYRINSRLFAAPLDHQAVCPVCRMPKEKHPQTENEPAFIRVSIPRSTLLPAYRYKAHRRCSFDPTDSLGLPSHCLSGWTNISMGVGSKMSSLDLTSSMKIRPYRETVPSAQNDSQMDLSRSWEPAHQSSDRVPEFSLLAWYQFRHSPAMRTKPFY